MCLYFAITLMCLWADLDGSILLFGILCQKWSCICIHQKCVCLKRDTSQCSVVISQYRNSSLFLFVWVYFWIFNSIPLFYMTVSVQIPCVFFYHYCFVVELEGGWWFPCELLILSRFIFAILFFSIPDQLGNWSISLKNWLGVVMGIALIL